jgi:hypothetical protein
VRKTPKAGPKGPATARKGKATPGGAAGAKQFLEAAAARRLETVTERCASLFGRLEASYPTLAMRDLWEEGVPGGDFFAASFIEDPTQHPRENSALVAAAYCVEAIKADMAGDYRHAWDAAFCAAELVAWLYGHAAGTSGAPLNQALSDLGRSGGAVRKNRSDTVRAEAERLYKAGNRSSALAAARAICDDVRAFGRQHNFHLTPTNAERTVHGWLLEYKKNHPS